MKATYKDIEFKSGLEVSWARFFDKSRLPWLYEPETFRDGRFSYTPDFKVKGSLWVEVKGKAIPMNPSLRLCPRPLVVLFGSPAVHYAILITDRLARYPYWEAALIALETVYDHSL